MSEDIVSPDCLHRVSFSSYEVRMSHWIDQPLLVRISDSTCLVALNASDWSAWTVHWRDNTIVELFMRKYPGQRTCFLTLNVETNQAEAISQTQSFAGPFSGVNDWLSELA